MFGVAGRVANAAPSSPQTAFEKTVTQAVGGLSAVGAWSVFLPGVGGAQGSISPPEFLGSTMAGILFIPGGGIVDEVQVGVVGTTHLVDDFTSIEFLGPGGFTLLTANVDSVQGFETISGSKFWKWGDDVSITRPPAWDGSGNVDVILNL